MQARDLFWLLSAGQTRQKKFLSTQILSANYQNCLMFEMTFTTDCSGCPKCDRDNKYFIMNDVHNRNISVPGFFASQTIPVGTEKMRKRIEKNIMRCAITFKV